MEGGMWSGTGYDLLSHNCVHFCRAFCKRLGVNSAPAWLTGLAGNTQQCVSCQCCSTRGPANVLCSMTGAEDALAPMGEDDQVVAMEMTTDPQVVVVRDDCAPLRAKE